MKIRAITAFTEVHYPLETGAITEIGHMLRVVRKALQEAEIEVQTTRLATQPFPDILDEAGPGVAVDLAKGLEALAFVHEIDYVALGLVRLDDPATYVDILPDILGNTESVFVGLEIANQTDGLDLPRIRRAADVVRRASILADDGFANLRLAALAHVSAWSPFFPAAYHGEGRTRVALATESADLAVTAISSATTLEEARQLLVSAIEAEAKRVEEIVQTAIDRFDVAFQGIDFSLAPYPQAGRSIGTALERLGLPSLGGQGSLAAAAFLADALDRAAFTRTGFCGLMLPVLEDSVLAQRAADGLFGINDLLIYSAVCGTGLDTIPLPGDVSADTLSAILIDVAALALRLGKPLTARLMPLPGKLAGDEVSFDFEYFASSRVLAPRGESLSRLLAGDERVNLNPRHGQND